MLLGGRVAEIGRPLAGRGMRVRSGVWAQTTVVSAAGAPGMRFLRFGVFVCAALIARAVIHSGSRKEVTVRRPHPIPVRPHTVEPAPAYQF